MCVAWHSCKLQIKLWIHAGSREAYRTPSSRLQRAGSAAASHGSWPVSERRQLQREASAEALAAEFEQSAGSGYKEVCWDLLSIFVHHDSLSLAPCASV